MLLSLGAEDWENCDTTVFQTSLFIPFQLEHFQLNGRPNNLLLESFEPNVLGMSNSPI
jgi:hypothetical protein